MDTIKAKQIIKLYEEGKTDLFNWCEEYKKFVDDNIYYCVSSEWEYMISKSYDDNESPCNYEDMDLYYYNEDDLINAIIKNFDELEEDEEIKYFLFFINEDLYQNQRTKKELSSDLKNHLLNEEDIDSLKDLINNELYHIIDFDLEDYQHNTEVYEWWLCSDLLKGLMPNEIFLNGAWGRQTTGQNISLDTCMIEAYIEYLKDYIKLVE